MNNRAEITAELSEKVLKKLRKEFLLVSSEVWVDERHRVDFIAYGIGSGYTNASVERGTFCFVEVKSCMDDFKSGHGLTFEGDENWMVCPRSLADALYEKRQSFRKLSTAALLLQMVTDSAESWRTTREVFYGEVEE